MRSFPLVVGITSAWAPPVGYSAYLLWHDWSLLGALDIWSFAIFLGGMLYTHGFIYWYHRFPMHQYYKVPGTAHIKDAHTRHHQAFPRSRLNITPDALLEPFTPMGGKTVRMNDMISQRWWIPSSLVALHIVAFSLIAGPANVMALGFGLVVHYTVYDVSHWFTHVRPTRFGIFLEQLPFIGNLWRLTMQIHDVHHTEPESDFNFTPPWLFDMLCGTFTTHITPRKTKR